MTASLPTRATADAAGALFNAIARRRHARALHPNGPTLTATAQLHGGLHDVPGFDAPREVDALVRLSRGIGIPGIALDFRGVAVRLLDVHGPGRHQDLLFTSCPPPPGHVVLSLARDETHQWYTTLLPYRVGERRAIPVAHTGDGRRFTLGVAPLAGRTVQPFATVTTGGSIAADDGERLRFDPLLHAIPQLRQDAGPLDVVRERAYQGSRAGRGVPAAG